MHLLAPKPCLPVEHWENALLRGVRALRALRALLAPLALPHLCSQVAPCVN